MGRVASLLILLACGRSERLPEQPQEPELPEPVASTGAIERGSTGLSSSSDPLESSGAAESVSTAVADLGGTIECEDPPALTILQSWEDPSTTVPLNLVVGLESFTTAGFVVGWYPEQVRLAQYDFAGELLWEIVPESQYAHASAVLRPLPDGGLLWSSIVGVQDFADSLESLRRIGPDGDVVWEQSRTASSDASTLAPGSILDLAVHSGGEFTLLRYEQPLRLIRHDTSGQELWSMPLGEVSAWTLAGSPSGEILIPARATDHWIALFDPAGASQWVFDATEGLDGYSPRRGLWRDKWIVSGSLPGLGGSGTTILGLDEVGALSGRSDLLDLSADWLLPWKEQAFVVGGRRWLCGADKGSWLAAFDGEGNLVWERTYDLEFTTVASFDDRIFVAANLGFQQWVAEVMP